MNNYNCNFSNSRRQSNNLQNGDVIQKSFRKSARKDCYFMSFRDNGKTYTILCYDNTYVPSSGRYANIDSKVGKVLVSKR